jgi:hypothetical protein
MWYAEAREMLLGLKLLNKGVSRQSINPTAVDWLFFFASRLKKIWSRLTPSLLRVSDSQTSAGNGDGEAGTLVLSETIVQV